MEAVLFSNAAVRSAAPREATTARLSVATLFFINGVLFASWVSRIPAVQSERGLNHAQLGLGLLVMALGALAAMPTAGWFSSRFGSRRVTQVTALACCASLPLLAIQAGPAFFAFALFVFGVAHGLLDVTMNAQAVAVEETYERPIMSSFHALFSVGGLVGAAFGAGIATAGMAPSLHFTGIALLAMICVALIVFPRLMENGKAAKPLAGVQARPRFRWPPGRLLVLGTVAFCVMMGEGAMADWSAVFLRRFAGTSDGVAAAGYAAFSIAMALGRFSGDRLSARFGAVVLVRAGGAFAAAGLSLALAWPQPIAALIGFAAVGAGFATIVPLVFSAAGRMPGLSPESALATATTIGYSGFLIGPPLIGFAAQAIGLRGALGIVVAMSILMVVLAPSLRRVRHSD
ncbi:MAG: MFS transporter [Verrucomicrobiota bacterium]